MNHNEFLPRADFDREIETDHATERALLVRQVIVMVLLTALVLARQLLGL